ncbi:DegT/DnrJ/EryC1/StrS family aminotransferase [Ornithinimicrobium sediminis]|uniref:DegT/DnrJ/EryC1/StrS family aminotransferase n=1 Tax=Ornithinimicrobium sediminis TaxID=2904603 RepID=UPI001E35707D|nr:aminotransferase class I/II-fold pyridoxal phosphate-dependent enzyme [Ornithinimicrobium sediminis]MCE0485994.1 aminotransferase class I/II-fold pyridoxal phosphate-dependent enzyme [Ornithinimicrobium sediminis]
MGGTIYLSKADVTAVEEEYVLNALRSGWIAPLGPDVDEFEAEIAERVGVKHALALASGTAALHLALLELGAGPGKVVVLPSMTFAASANAVVYSGAEPVFVDSQPGDGNVDPHRLVEAVDTLRAEGRDVAGVMTVDLFGRACDYDAIVPALEEREVPLLEDAAEALGASFHGVAAGAFGRAAALSFNGNKIMTTSGGGMLLSNDSGLVAHARKLSTQAREPAAWYEHREIGFNYRMSNLLAALGRAQLTRLDAMMERRREIRRRYVQALGDLPVRFLGADTGRSDASDNCWLTALVVEDDEADVTHVLSELTRRGIEARHLWKPMHMQPSMAGARTFGARQSEGLFRRGAALPSGSALTDSEVDYVIAAVVEVLAT